MFFPSLPAVREPSTIDIPDAAGYHLCRKSGWNSSLAKVRILLCSRYFSATTVPASERRSNGGQPSPHGMGTMLLAHSIISRSGTLNENMEGGSCF